jgi:hypothetical protein
VVAVQVALVVQEYQPQELQTLAVEAEEIGIIFLLLAQAALALSSSATQAHLLMQQA